MSEAPRRIAAEQTERIPVSAQRERELPLPGGVLEWTSPAGRVYPDVPRRALEFTAAIAAGAPPPF